MRNKKIVIKCLKTTPVVQIACQQASISRATYYRWRKKGKKFKIKSDIALKNGINFISDLAESQLIKKIKEGNLTAIIYWLKNHHQDYNEKILLRLSKKSTAPHIGVEFVLDEDPKPGNKIISG